MTVSRIETTSHRFAAHELALRAAASVFAAVKGVSRSYTDLAEQARRAAASVPLNLAEGAGRGGKDRVYHFRVAYGSVQEAHSAVRLLEAVGAVRASQAKETLELLDRVGAMTWRLVHNPGPGR